jgi:DNA modification methylase
MLKQQVFGNLDFDTIGADKDFNEADVRAVIIDPILKELGFTHENILREKALQSPFLRTGSKKRTVTLIPDYALKVGNSVAWVLDAKSPAQSIRHEDHIEQAYSYAAHPEIRSTYFALCNGLEFACWRTAGTSEPVLYFPVSGIDGQWEALRRLLSPDSFREGKKFVYEKAVPPPEKTDFEYPNRPLPAEIAVKKRAAKRHFGVHGYFTRQSWDIVSAYIENFSQEGDTVLDPFGGSGVTAVEALILNRKAVHIDINPLANFMVRSLLAPVNTGALSEAYREVREAYRAKEPKTEAEIAAALTRYPGPRNLPLPGGSDVGTVSQLFSPGQTAQLALLKSIIQKQKDPHLRDTLLLMFSGMVTRVNLTYHTSTIATKDGQGNASAFQYYRYRVAPAPTTIDVIKYLDIRFKKIKAAKEEIAKLCLLKGRSAEEIFADARIVKGTATDLSFLPKESVDYIYTDPPYGRKIPYLDLSVMWNAWLDLDVSEEDYALEAIEGGEHRKTKEDYNRAVAKSIGEMYRVLKFDRWLSFVFAHKDPEFWHLIIETAEKCGFEYVGAVPQKNGQTSFKKRRHPFTVLSGQLILNFRKTKNPRAVLKANLGMDIGEIVIETVEGAIAQRDGATLEQINDELIIKGLELGFLDLLKKRYSDLTPLLLDRFEYDGRSQIFSIKKDTRFTTHIDVRLRIKYYMLSYLRRMEREHKTPSFNEIVFAIMPLLKNGITPEHQTILSVLEDIGEPATDGCWRLKTQSPSLF